MNLNDKEKATSPNDLQELVNELQERAKDYRQRVSLYEAGKIDELTLTETLLNAAKTLEVTASMLKQKGDPS